MKELLEELKATLKKHNALIFLEEEDGFLYLQIIKDSEEGTELISNIDSGYRDLMISAEVLDREIEILSK